MKKILLLIFVIFLYLSFSCSDNTLNEIDKTNVINFLSEFNEFSNSKLDIFKIIKYKNLVEVFFWVETNKTGKLYNIIYNNDEIISSQIWGRSFLQELPDIAFYFNFPWDIISNIKKKIN